MSCRMPSSGSKNRVGQLTPKPGSVRAKGSGQAVTVPLQTFVPANLSGQDETVWSGSALTQDGVHEYEAFITRGVTIKKNSFVYVRGVGGQRHIAHIVNMYEQNGQKLLKINWFWQQGELPNPSIFRDLNVTVNEIFYDQRTAVVSVCCVDDIATVLTPRDWERLSSVNAEIRSSAHICCRKVIGDTLSELDISNLHGYYLQSAFNYVDQLPMPDRDGVKIVTDGAT